MHRSTQIEDRDAALLAGDVAPLSRSAWADNVIQFIPRNAAAEWDDEAGEFDDTFESIGSLAVRLVGNFLLPRLLVVRQDQS